MSRKFLFDIFFENIPKEKLNNERPVEDIADALLKAICHENASVFPENAFQAEHIHKALNPNDYDRGFHNSQYEDIQQLVMEGFHHLVIQGFLAPQFRSKQYFVTRLGKNRFRKLIERT